MKVWAKLTASEQTEVRVAYVFGRCKTIPEAAARYSVSEKTLYTVCADEKWSDERRKVGDFRVDEAKQGFNRCLSDAAMNIAAGVQRGSEVLAEMFENAQDSENPEDMVRAWGNVTKALDAYKDAAALGGDPFLTLLAPGEEHERVGGLAGGLITVPPDATEAAAGLTQVAVRVLMAEFTAKHQAADLVENPPRAVEAPVTPAPQTQPVSPSVAPQVAPQPPSENGKNGIGPRKLFSE